MGLGVSLILIAVGAILTWAVEAHVSGLNVTAVGVILMVVGLVGGLLSLAFWSSWWGPGYFRRYAAAGPAGPAPARRRRVRYPDERPVAEEEIVEEERY
jgi:membrane protein implicated in regulation of membrane protease activity